MAANGASLVHALNGAGEQMGNVSALEDEEDDPVDTGDNMVHPESSVVVIVLAPYPPAVQSTIIGCIKSIIERDDQGQEPGDSGEDLVGDNGVLAVFVAFSERVDYSGIAKHLISK